MFLQCGTVVSVKDPQPCQGARAALWGQSRGSHARQGLEAPPGVGRPEGLLGQLRTEPWCLVGLGASSLEGTVGVVVVDSDKGLLSHIWAESPGGVEHAGRGPRSSEGWVEVGGCGQRGTGNCLAWPLPSSWWPGGCPGKVCRPWGVGGGQAGTGG